MDIYGKKLADSDEPMKIEEVALVVSASELNEIIRFLSACSVDLASNRHWDHAHLRDFLKQKNISSDLVICITG